MNKRFKNKLLETFNVKSYIELQKYLKENPDDENAVSLNNITKKYIEEADEEVKVDEQ